METELTKEIKKALRNYRPLMKSNARTIRWAEEVDVGTGFVDSIRFEDYVKETKEVVGCRSDLYGDGKKTASQEYCNKTPCEKCYLYGKYTQKILGIACTCFEVKITKSDFKSNNGHNFAGNFNYYVVPKELYKEILELVPEDIGIILYYGHGYLKIKKECKFKEVDAKNLNKYMFNALKKWCDLNCFTYEKYIE